MEYRYQGKLIGKVEDGVLKKTVSKKKHLFKKTNSWGIDKWLLEQLPDETIIEIYDRDDKKMYRATKKDYWSKGQIADYGFGKQVMLTRSLFHG